MKEIYVNSPEAVELNIYENSQRVQADATPTVSATDLETGDAVSVGAVTLDGSTYSVSIDASELDRVRTIQVDWTYEIDGLERTAVSYVEVVQPLALPDEIIGSYPRFAEDGTEPKTIQEIKGMERIVRKAIESHTYQSFAPLGVQTFRLTGAGTNALQLNERIYELEYVAQVEPHGAVLYDQTVDGNGLLYQRDNNGAIIDDNTPLTIPNSEAIEAVSWNSDDWVIHRIGTRFVPWNPSMGIFDDVTVRHKIFESKGRYIVRGKAGWEYVPNEVNQAAILLIADYFCPDIAWHAKNFNSVKSADYSMQGARNHYGTTGNVVADQLLSKYRNIGAYIL